MTVMRCVFAMSVALAACAMPVDENGGLSAPKPDPAAACELNPYAVCYPTADVGVAVRSGSQYGNRIPNLKFVGFRSQGTATLDPSSAPTSVSLADYYDPLGMMGNILIVIVSNHVWCGPSNEEADFLSGANFTGANTGGASWAKELAPLGIVVIEALDDGPVWGTSATLDDLRTYVTRHDSDYTSVLDGDRSLALYFPTQPWNPDVLILDARSMEILSATVGFDTNADVTLAALARATRSSAPRP